MEREKQLFNLIKKSAYDRIEKRNSVKMKTKEVLRIKYVENDNLNYTLVWRGTQPCRNTGAFILEET